MNYYPFHIGDYAAHTQRLSLMEDLAYRRLIDAYYLAERPLSGCASDVAREIGMQDQIDAVTYVLTKFFTPTEDGFRNDRCEKEIAHFRDKKAKASSAGKASAQRRLNGRSTSVGNKATSVEDFPTDEQLTNNQEPITKIINTTASPDGFAEFYQKYPKKVGRPAAEKAFKSAKGNTVLEKMLEDIDRRLMAGEWTLDKRQFIPNPATYLNQRRWEDGSGEDESAPNPLFAGMINARP